MGDRFSIWQQLKRYRRRTMTSNAAPSTDSDPFADRRATPRAEVALPGFMTVAGHRIHVQLLDVSAGGARLSTSHDLVAGQSIELDCGTLTRGATVRWTGGGTAGVSFDSELTERETAALIARSSALEKRMAAR